MSKKLFVHVKDESARMFKNDTLNALSKVHYTVPLYLYIPPILYFLYVTIFQTPVEQVSILGRVGLWFAGLFTWSFFEYGVHRFIFHYNASSEIGKRFHFLSHGVHHDYPQDSTRLVMPPSVSLPLAVLFFFAFSAILGPFMMAPAFVGFLMGYLVYDMSHYAVHHFNWKTAYFQRIKKHHMDHHFRDPDYGFGFTSDIWDKVFNTNLPVKPKASQEKSNA
jgi:sterol desaturase/sphingolipid hydroxylase (fatty acid hydroxylase superfamily)